MGRFGARDGGAGGHGGLRRQQREHAALHPHFEPQRTNDALAVSRSDDDVVYVGVEQRGIYVTRDGGETWELKINGLRLATGIETGEPCMTEPFQM